MYVGPRRRQRRSSPWRVIFLLILIAAGIYVYTLIKQERIANPLVPTPVPPTPTRSALSHADEAQQLYLEGKLEDAIAAYRRAIALEPDDVLFHIPLAKLLALDGRTIEAVRTAKGAVDMAPENAQAWAVLGMAYDWNGDVPEAIDACKRAIELDPTYPEAYAYLAEAYADAVRWGEAVDAAQTALQLNDRSVDAHRNYGYVLERQGNYWGAAEAYERALEIHPNLAYIHIAAGRNYQVLGQFDQAVSSFLRAVEIDPNNADSYDRLGWAYYNIGEYERAETYLKQAIEADPEFSRAYGHLATNYWVRRNYEAAIENFEPAIEFAAIESRREAERFIITLEDVADEHARPSADVVMQGELVAASGSDENGFRATLEPKDLDDEAWAEAQGSVTLDARTGEYTLNLDGMAPVPQGRVYVGWFDGLNALSGDPLSTGPLAVRRDGTLEADFEATWVEGPRIEYYYTLGLAYFYMAECEKSYPLFDAALQIDPEEANALEGIRLCQEAEEADGS